MAKLCAAVPHQTAQMIISLPIFSIEKYWVLPYEKVNNFTQKKNIT